MASYYLYLAGEDRAHFGFTTILLDSALLAGRETSHLAVALPIDLCHP